VDIRAPIDLAEELLDRGASPLGAARTIAEARGISLTEARAVVLAARKRAHRDEIEIRSEAIEDQLEALAGIGNDDNAIAAAQALTTYLRAVGALDEDAGLRRAKSRAANARAAKAERESSIAERQMALDLRRREADTIRAEVEARAAQRAAGEDGADPAEGYWNPALEVDAPDADAEAARGATDDLHPR
jgi:DNA polymerase elongation subunit (family B)